MMDTGPITGEIDQDMSCLFTCPNHPWKRKQIQYLAHLLYQTNGTPNLFMNLHSRVRFFVEWQWARKVLFEVDSHHGSR